MGLSTLNSLLEGLKTRDNLEEALAIAVACLMTPTKVDPQEVLFKVVNPSVGSLLLTTKQADMYAQARLALYQQRS